MLGWFFFLILSAACAFFNPYVGLFSVFNIAELIIFFCYDAVAKSRFNLSYFKKDEGTDYTKQLDKAARRIAASWCVVSVVLFVITSVVNALVWALASGTLGEEAKIVAVLDVIPDEIGLGFTKRHASIALLAAGIIFNLIAVILVFFRRAKLINGSKTKTDEIKQAAENVKFRMGIPAIFLLVLAAAAGVLDMKIGWLSLIFHAAYLLLVGITYLLVFVNKKCSKLDNSLGNSASYFMNEIITGGHYNKLLIGILWMITGIIISTEAVKHFVIYNTLQNASLLQWK